MTHRRSKLFGGNFDLLKALKLGCHLMASFFHIFKNILVDDKL
jgi:hypothetical protein